MVQVHPSAHKEVQAEFWTTATVLKTVEVNSPCGFETHCFRAMDNFNGNCVPQVLNSFIYQYPKYTTKKTVTTVREYENEKLVKETVTEVTETAPEYHITN